MKVLLAGATGALGVPLTAALLAEAATVAALDRGRAGQAYNVVDDLPVSWADLFTATAAAVGAARQANVRGVSN